MLHINPKTGLVAEARFCPSPNADDRPAAGAIDLLVIHSISLPPGEYGGPAIEDFFCNQLDHSAHPYFAEICDLRVSAHVLIRRDGELLQFVPFHQRAWHAGASSYRGRECCNDYSIGIELEGTDDSAFEAVQYHALAGLVQALETSYPEITRLRMTGHSDIAPGRKTDPGTGFDWQQLESLLDDPAQETHSAKC